MFPDREESRLTQPRFISRAELGAVAAGHGGGRAGGTPSNAFLLVHNLTLIKLPSVPIYSAIHLLPSRRFASRWLAIVVLKRDEDEIIPLFPFYVFVPRRLALGALTSL